jgi:AcrR family transcriptional regulator
MSPRDMQEYESRRQQIIDGALQVFGSKGFEKATNKDIAEAAKIGSPGLIYHYFKDKTDLLLQVVEERAPVLQLLSHPQEMMDLPPREALTLFASRFMKMLDNRAAVPLFKMMLSEAIRRPALAEAFNRIGPGRGLALLQNYLAHQMDLGTIRRMNPAVAARCFIGPLLAYVFTREVFVQPDAGTLRPESMVEAVVEVFLGGMEENRD